MRTRTKALAALILSGGLLATGVLPAHADEVLSLTAKTCSGGAHIRVTSGGYGDGYHTIYHGPSSSETWNFHPSNNNYYSTTTSFNSTSMSSGYAERDIDIVSASRSCG
jgi:hypothetical protein